MSYVSRAAFNSLLGDLNLYLDHGPCGEHHPEHAVLKCLLQHVNADDDRIVEELIAAYAQARSEDAERWAQATGQWLKRQEERRLREERALTVDCPWCGQAAGNPCIYDTGKNRGRQRPSAHEDRDRNFHGLARSSALQRRHRTQESCHG